MITPERYYHIRTAHAEGDVAGVINLVNPGLRGTEAIAIGNILDYQINEVYAAKNLAPKVVFPNGTFIEACPVPDKSISIMTGSYAVGINGAWEFVSPRMISLNGGDDQSFYGNDKNGIQVPFNTRTTYCTSNGLVQRVEIFQGGFTSRNLNLSAIVYGSVRMTEAFVGSNVPGNIDFAGSFVEVDEYLTKLGIYSPRTQKSILDPIFDRVAHYVQMPFKGALKAINHEQTRSGLVFNSQITHPS